MSNNQPEDSASEHSSNCSLIPVTKWNQFHHWPPLGGLRHLIFNAQSNGFASAFKKVGRRVLIDEKEFFEIIKRKNLG